MQVTELGDLAAPSTIVNRVLPHNLKYHERGVHTLSIKCPRKNCHFHVKPTNSWSNLMHMHDRYMKTCKNCGKMMKSSNLHFKKGCNKKNTEL